MDWGKLGEAPAGKMELEMANELLEQFLMLKREGSESRFEIWRDEYQSQAQQIKNLVTSRLSKYQRYEVLVEAKKYTQADKWTDMLVESYLRRKKEVRIAN